MQFQRAGLAGLLLLISLREAAPAASGRPFRVHPEMAEVQATTFLRGIRSNRSRASASLPDFISPSSRLQSRTTSGGTALRPLPSAAAVVGRA